MKILSEFQKFISRGNVVDLAVAVIVGGAFQKIVSSLVADLLMPPLGLLIGGVHFSSLKLRVGGSPDAPVTLNYGMFGQTVLDFLILAFAVFVLVQLRSTFLKQEEAKAPEPGPSKEESLLTEIRDLLMQANEQAKT